MALVVVEEIELSVNKSEQKKSRQVPAWKIRIQNKIEKLRRDLGRLNEIVNNDMTKNKKLKETIQDIYKIQINVNAKK